MDFKGIDLNLLVAFDALMQERNVSRAGASIGVSQPAMSAALSRLRILVGDHLFTRTSAGLQPTQRARDLAEPVAMALQHIQAAFVDKEFFDPAKASFTFAIGMADHPSVTLLPEIAKALSKQAPYMKLKVVTFSGKDVAIDLLDAGKIDVAIGVLPKHTDARIVTKEIFKDQFVTIVSRDNLASRSRLTLERFLRLPHILVSPEGDEYGVVDKKLAELNKTRNIMMTQPHMHAAAGVVAETNLISTILKGVALASSYKDKLVLFQPPINLDKIGFHLIWHRRNETHPAQEWVRGLISQVGISCFPNAN